MTRSPRPLAAGAAAVLALAACSPAPQVRVCATDTRPPIVVAYDDCDTDRPGLRWYSAPASDVSADDAPILDEPLDGDFWDVRDQLDLVEHARPSTSRPRPSVTRTPRSTR